jgi:hypothetical protein
MKVVRADLVEKTRRNRKPEPDTTESHATQIQVQVAQTHNPQILRNSRNSRSPRSLPVRQNRSRRPQRWMDWGPANPAHDRHGEKTRVTL